MLKVVQNTGRIEYSHPCENLSKAKVLRILAENDQEYIWEVSFDSFKEECFYKVSKVID